MNIFQVNDRMKFSVFYFLLLFFLSAFFEFLQHQNIGPGNFSVLENTFNL